MSVYDHLVIGGGVIGLSTALELVRRGRHVHLLDAAEGVGLGTSFANGGLITPSMSDPWNTPGVHRHLVDSLLSSHAALKLRFSALPSLAFWGPRFLLHSRPASYRATAIANFELAIYSLAMLKKLVADHRLDFDLAEAGSLKLFRSGDALAASLATTRLLEPHGLDADVLDDDGAVEAEPCLAPIRDRIVGAIRYSQDAAGDAFLFCRAAADAFQRQGGTIGFGRRVDRIVRSAGGAVAAVRAGGETIEARSVIVAAGVASPALTSRLGLRLPIKPVKGYSVTYQPGSPPPCMPRMPVIDDALHAAVTPLGSRLRVAGTAEFAGGDLSIDPKRIANLSTLIEAIFPGLVDEKTKAAGHAWTGLRPVTADGKPYIGASTIPGLWINCGHGHLGWTMAAGSARLLADLIDGTTAEVDPQPFRLRR